VLFYQENASANKSRRLMPDVVSREGASPRIPRKVPCKDTDCNAVFDKFAMSNPNSTSIG
jgi:hypothetical protein